MAAGGRRRQLPAWMGAAGAERAAAAPGPPAGRRRAAGRRSAALYCMNEAELVEVALAVLAEDLQCEEGEEKARSRSEEEQELPPTPNEAPGSTDGGSDRGPALPSPPGAGAVAEGTGGEDSEDDALKYVREIFFS